VKPASKPAMPGSPLNCSMEYRALPAACRSDVLGYLSAKDCSLLAGSAQSRLAGKFGICVSPVRWSGSTPTLCTRVPFGGVL
jgi:hypothetical protein